MALTRLQQAFLLFALLVAIACSVWVAASPGFAVTPVLGMTVIAILLTGSLAYTLFTHSSEQAKEVGAALVSGAVFLLAAAMTQAASDINTFRNSVAFEQDLHGFDPGGRSLRGFNFGGKDLSVANLSGIDLRHARLRQTDLSTADLSFANLSRADLFYAQLHEADVHGADLRGADLRGAKLGTRLPNNLDSTMLSGAQVSDDTCWRIPTSTGKDALPHVTPTPRGWQTLEVLIKGRLAPPAPGRPLGHVCMRTGGELSINKPATVLVYICNGWPHLREASQMHHAAGRDGLWCDAP